MTIASEKLIQDLIERTRVHINKAEKLNTLSIEKLNWKEEKDSWSVLECIEHLNRYAIFYNKEITKKMYASTLPFSETFKSVVPKT